MPSIKSGKSTLLANNDSLQINFEQNYFANPPSVAVSTNENIILYLHEITSNYVIIKISDTLSYNIEINYSAVEIEN